MMDTYHNFDFPYGEATIHVSIPARRIAYVLSRVDQQPLLDQSAVITAALRSPIGCRPLAESIRRESRIAVIVTDNTRACPDDRLLPPILAELEQVVRAENITIIVALGLHAALDRSDLIAKLGKSVVEKYRVVNHDIDDVIHLGRSTRGIPIEVNRQLVEADFRISTGFIEPHFFAGFSGGGKSIMPGVSSRSSISQNHGCAMIDHPLSRAGILRGNPIHEDIVEHATKAQLNFIVNVLLNEKQEIIQVVAGDPVQAHEKGCEIEKSLVGVHLDRQVDITVTSNSGAPLDLDLYQTCKGIDNAARITREGGIIIIASACNKGVGADSFCLLHSSAGSPGAVIEKIRCGGSAGVNWQNQVLARAQMTHDIYIVSELDPGVARKMMIVPVSSIEAGLDKAFGVLGKRAKVAVIPEGPLILPLLES